MTDEERAANDARADDVWRSFGHSEETVVMQREARHRAEKKWAADAEEAMTILSQFGMDCCDVSLTVSCHGDHWTCETSDPDGVKKTTVTFDTPLEAVKDIRRQIEEAFAKGGHSV